MNMYPFQRLGAVLPFPFARTIHTDQNNPKLEFLFAACEGQPAVRQKMLILMARAPEVGLLNETDATIAMNALGIGNA